MDSLEQRETERMTDTLEILECGHAESPHSSFTRGYGEDSKGNRSCYACCADYDRQIMRDTGKICLYLTLDDDTGRTLNQFGRRYGNHKLSNWPGSLELPVHCIKTGRHNIAGTRYDCWFTFDNTNWHGVQYGDNTQICHCTRLKS